MPATNAADWEYLVQEHGSSKQLTDALNHMAQEGWEPVDLELYGSLRYVVVLRRDRDAIRESKAGGVGHAATEPDVLDDVR